MTSNYFKTILFAKNAVWTLISIYKNTTSHQPLKNTHHIISLHVMRQQNYYIIYLTYIYNYKIIHCV